MRRFTQWFDAAAEQRARRTAQSRGRRSLLARLGQVMVGAAAFPVLPYDRSSIAHATGAGGGGGAKPAQPESSCDYWRHCAIDGFLCSCCGGSLTQCPPGTEHGKVTWIGTCRNPKDGLDYLISYYDCCGRVSCGRCLCNNNERERPGYLMSLHNDINWCMATPNSAYHCTVSAIVGVAQKK